MLMFPSYQVGRGGRASETFKTAAEAAASVLGMKLQLSVVELVVTDMAATLGFYRRVGLDVPPDADQAPHVDVELAGGLRLAFDTEETIRSFDPRWTRPPGGGHRAALAFVCESPAAVDAAWADLTGAGYAGHLPPWDAFWGMRYAVVRDPDGTPVDLFAPQPPAS
jgi:catechol 2,3-dioxygenase-like lactoylglutathione lyase family enzyme